MYCIVFVYDYTWKEHVFWAKWKVAHYLGTPGYLFLSYLKKKSFTISIYNVILHQVLLLWVDLKANSVHTADWWLQIVVLIRPEHILHEKSSHPCKISSEQKHWPNLRPLNSNPGDSHCYTRPSFNTTDTPAQLLIIKSFIV